MSALVKYKNPTEYSFYLWMSGFPESGHPHDRKRFVEFVKNVCVFNAKKWKDVHFLKKRILKIKPKFNENNLYYLLSIHEYILHFYEVSALPRCWRLEDSINVEHGFYIERGIKNGKFYDKEISLKIK